MDDPMASYCASCDKQFKPGQICDDCRPSWWQKIVGYLGVLWAFRHGAGN